MCQVGLKYLTQNYIAIWMVLQDIKLQCRLDSTLISGPKYHLAVVWMVLQPVQSHKTTLLGKLFQILTALLVKLYFIQCLLIYWQVKTGEDEDR